MKMAYAGYEFYTKKKDNSFGAEATAYAKKALNLLEAGKIPEKFEPFTDRAEAEAMMYYIIGAFTVENDLKTAAENFYKAVRFESKIKTGSYPYYIIAFYYEKSYETAAKEFETKHGEKDFEDEEFKDDLKKLERIADRMIDAYARAVKYAEAENNLDGEEWKRRLAEIYKFRNETDFDLNEILTQITKTTLENPAEL